jgi:hypothetical protein
MTLKKVYECYVCGTERKDANHWFVVEPSRVGFHLWQWDWAIREGRLDDDGVEHVCGQACAHKLLDRFLTLQGTEN